MQKLAHDLIEANQLLERYREYAEVHNTEGMMDDLALELNRISSSSASFVNSAIEGNDTDKTNYWEKFDNYEHNRRIDNELNENEYK